MHRFSLMIAAIAALSTSACVAIPVTGTFAGGGTSATAAAPSLQNQLAGNSLTPVGGGYAMHLWSDGSLTLQVHQDQAYGTWSANGDTFCNSITLFQEVSQGCYTTTINGSQATMVDQASGRTTVYSIQ